MRKITGLLVIAFLGGVISLGGYKLLIEKQQTTFALKNQGSSLQMLKTNYNPMVVNKLSSPTGFTQAAEKTVNAVVHVKNISIKTKPNSSLFFPSPRNGQQQYKIGTGSGVIISPDGYIITNNHVIEGASEIQVTLNNRKKMTAKLVGADSKDDIALLKINSEVPLPYITFGNSDNVKIGEWVLAIGDPYNLTSTVTAGIVSAKGRDLQGNNNIDSYIQTDAAVNPGNSGGALVNTRGELIGINSAISSQTGSFIGYSFAIPSNIAKKIIDDIMEFGNVQEAILGVRIAKGEDDIDGVLLEGVDDNSGAKKAGLQAGDIIIKIGNVKIDKFSQLKGQLTAKRPGQTIRITILRNGNKIVKKVTLIKKDFTEVRSLGIILKNLSKEDMKMYGLKGGAKIISSTNPNLNYYGVKKGYIITKVNKKNVTDAIQAKELLNTAYRINPMYIEVINLRGEKERYAF